MFRIKKRHGSDIIAVDWDADIEKSRDVLGHDVPVSSNLDPTELFGTDEHIMQPFRDCIEKDGGQRKHLLNLGHGVIHGAPEDSVDWSVYECEKCKGNQSKNLFLIKLAY